MGEDVICVISQFLGWRTNWINCKKLFFENFYLVFMLSRESNSSNLIKFNYKNLVKVSDSDYDVNKIANERPVYTVLDQW